ncbi:MAG: HAMP domain-containing protein [Armatimonadetes bacterium]|nr:HAMP domain-containing protein [Armatimonadota bacterium]
MRRSLLWKLLGINLLVVGVAVFVAAITIRQLSDVTFTSIMQEYRLRLDFMRSLFTESLARSLVKVSLVAGGIGLLLSLVLFRQVVRPVRGMMQMAERIAAGDYAARAPRISSADEVGSLAESLNRMAAALQTLERLRKDLVANVAHELRTPLANLRGYLEAIHDGVTPATSEAIGFLHEEVMRLVRLVDALHELSVFDAHLPRVQAAPVDIGALMQRLLDLRRGEFQAKGLVVHTQVSVNGNLHADADLVSQALHNLIDNALKFTPTGGEVTVRVTETGESVRIGVTNTGEGIAPEDLPYIFERFYRGDKSRSRSSGGAGIGLAIVKEVARVHGGDVGASSEGGITTVWLTLAPPASGT